MPFTEQAPELASLLLTPPFLLCLLTIDVFVAKKNKKRKLRRIEALLPSPRVGDANVEALPPKPPIYANFSEAFLFGHSGS